MATGDNAFLLRQLKLGSLHSANQSSAVADPSRQVEKDSRCHTHEVHHEPQLTPNLADHVSTTSASKLSLCSHSVFTLRVLRRNTVSGDSSEGSLNLVDLTGSE